MKTTDLAAYEQRRDLLVRELAESSRNGKSVRLEKSTSNLFRHRSATAGKGINVRDFSHVLSVDAEARTANVEGMATYEEIVDETLRFNLLPAVVPQLKTITIGGAVSGLGIESSS